MDSRDKFWFWLLFWILMIQILIVAHNLFIFWTGHASDITWFNIILNTVFGIMNLNLMFKIHFDE